ncbi:MAG: hypothetical protein JWQ40_4032 [Segetibacter sp.]|jgi:acyl carrier protein|nr:hypothetical protein [Segetibacter sp.]
MFIKTTDNMITKDEIIEIIFNSIDEINEQNRSSIPKEASTTLFGSQSELDSLGLVHLITSIEEKTEEATGKNITIADEKAMSLSYSPFKTVETLANYIKTLVDA